MAHDSYDVVVVGAGAAGLMAAGRAAALGKSVLLLEKNKRVGEKLRITGGGRCNIANAEKEERVLLRAYGKAEQFLYSLFAQFGGKDTFSFFESLGLPVVVQAQQRAFPKSEKAADVVRVLEKYARDNGVVLRTGEAVTEITSGPNGIAAVMCGTKCYSGKQFIFATGSLSHPETGSTGDGFAWLKKLGHTVHAPTPTIVPLKVADAWPKRLAGSSLSGMKITFHLNGKKAFSKTGKLLFTHFGISGPLVLNSAGAVADLLYGGEVTAHIDTAPELDAGAFEQKIIAAFDANKNKAVKNVLKEVAEPAAVKAALALLQGVVDGDTKTHSITKEKRKMFVKTLKALPLTIEGLMGFDRAVIADGGVPLNEVDTRSMCSKKVQNLFLVGDLLHISRPSGGYSLQLCWSTGFVAGTHAAEAVPLLY